MRNAVSSRMNLDFLDEGHTDLSIVHHHHACIGHGSRPKQGEALSESSVLVVSIISLTASNGGTK